MEGIEWAYIISAFVGGGGLVAIFRARAEAPKLAAEAQSVVITNLISENTRLTEQNERQRKELQAVREELESVSVRLRLLEDHLQDCIDGWTE